MVRRWIMHVDMDAFYASVEQRDHSEWRGKPVIVGSASPRGVVATASYEARRYGVHSAMPGRRARECCPEAIFVRPRMGVYRAVSAQIHEVLLHYAPEFEPLSLDEAFLDVSGMGGHYPTLQALGRAVKAEILAVTELTASVGIAPNKFLAKLASDWHKPDGLTVIGYGEEAARIAPLSVRRLWGVGPKTQAALEAGGLRTIGDVAAADPEELAARLGAQGRVLYELAHGRDNRPLTPHESRKSIGEEETFARDLTTAAEVRTVLLRQCDTVAYRLRRHHVRARTVTLKVRFASFRTLTRSKTVTEPMDLDRELYSEVERLYNQISKTEGIRLLGVTASSLVPAVDAVRLFADESEREQQVAAVRDRLRDKYGADVLRRGYWLEEGPEEEEDTDGQSGTDVE